VRLGKWVEIRFCFLWALVLISCNPFVIFCKNFLIVDWRDQSLLQSRSSWTELGEQSLVCLFPFFHCLWFYVFSLWFIYFRSRCCCLSLLIVCGYFNIGYHFPLLHTHHSLYWREVFRPNFTTWTTFLWYWNLDLIIDMESLVANIFIEILFQYFPDDKGEDFWIMQLICVRLVASL